jgi:hypothetical protein
MVAKGILLTWCVAWASAVGIVADVPGLLNYQGRLSVGASVFDGVGEFKFALVNGDGSIVYWGNAPDLNHDGQPDSAVSLTLTRGLYSVALGDTNLANMALLPVNLFTNSAVYLRVWFNDNTNGFQLLTPDQRITAVGYAMMAASVPDGAITAAQLAPGTLSAGNLTGTLAPAQVPDLDAGKITAGTLSASRLPANVAYKDTDLLSTSNALSASLEATNARLVAQLGDLSAQISALSGRLLALSNYVDASAPSGMAVVSTEAQAAALVAKGYQSFMSVPAPAWVNGTTTDSPSARYGHVAVWTGQRMIIWGGNLGSGYLSRAGSAYDPALDEWSAISPVDAPTARSGHTAVWSGQEMILWGGYAAGAYLDSGGRFQPDIPLWTALPASDAPAGREGHVAAWTGTQMIIWGGRNSSGLLGDGARYEAAANQWKPLNLAGPPAARFSATAVWAQDRLIVWGGEGSGGALNTGAQLVFDADGNPAAWQPVNPTNAPTARSAHSAVWTGQKMIVWGGQNNGSFLGDGAAYDPIADSWAAIGSLGAPSGRSGHCALWIGQEMAVLGGENATGGLASGSAYNPTSDGWRELSSAGHPTPRSDATAVWTGNELLVFGGRLNGQAVGSLQRLNPQPTWYFYRKP